MFPAVARRRGGRPVRTCHLRMSARLAFIFRPMESFTLWAGGTPVMSSSLILSSMIPAATVGQPSQPVPLSVIRTAATGSRIYTAGGLDIATLTDETNSFVYDPVADSITTIASIPRATSNTRALNFNGLMLVMGGAFNSPSNEVDAY